MTKPYGAAGGQHLNEWGRCHPASSEEFGNSGKSLIEEKSKSWSLCNVKPVKGVGLPPRKGMVFTTLVFKSEHCLLMQLRGNHTA